VIFLGPATSEVATWVRDSGGGWVVPTGDVDGLLRAIEHARQPAERLRRGEAARAYSRVHFDRQTNTTQIAETLEACVTERES
jgi:glycosyltransferase involved in cell wall biosynthesis